MSSTNIAVPGTVVPTGSLIAPGGGQGIQGLQGPQGIPWQGFMTKTATYTLTTADSAKYIICSGGSWTLTLPAPALGLAFQIRNDMGISGTTGTITLQPAAGTIDGLASIPLLPQQECLIISDGANWRTFGRQRVVVIGTQNITSSVANGSILLPAGFKYFELIWDALGAVTDVNPFYCQFSSDGGNTWIAGGLYYYGFYYNGPSDVMASQHINAANNAQIGSVISNLAPAAKVKMTLYPGTASLRPCYLSDSSSYYSSATLQARSSFAGQVASNVLVNALQYFMGSGNISNSFLTVKGIV